MRGALALVACDEGGWQVARVRQALPRLHQQLGIESVGGAAARATRSTARSAHIGPTQTCEVTGGSGTVGSDNVASVVINCAIGRFLITGSVSGLIGTVSLRNNGGDNLDVTANGQFAFPTLVASGATYSVTVLTQPSGPAQGAYSTFLTADSTHAMMFDESYLNL